MLAVGEVLKRLLKKAAKTKSRLRREKDWLRSTLFVKIDEAERRRFDLGNKEIARKRGKETEVMSWLMMCLMLLLRSKDSCLIYRLTLNNTFHKVIQSLNVEVAILARRQSGPLLFQGILSSRWWYQ